MPNRQNRYQQHPLASHSFIHATKTGGTALICFIVDHYSEYIRTYRHETLCGSVKNPIIIFRDPIDRFVSMFKYWKYGSEFWPMHPEVKAFRADYDINAYAKLVVNRKFGKLNGGATREVHAQTQSYWYNCPLEKIKVIKYKNNLESSIYKLFDELGIENKNIPFPKLNISNRKKLNVSINDSTKFLLRDFFKEDFKLMKTIENYPEKFNLVI
jgi:hypothetical protein